MLSTLIRQAAQKPRQPTAGIGAFPVTFSRSLQEWKDPQGAFFATAGGRHDLGLEAIPLSSIVISSINSS